jgi:cytochrome c553
VKKFFTWTGFIVAALMSVVLMGGAYIYFASEYELGREFSAPDATALVIPTDAAEIAAGKRIAQLAGCLHCHGEDLSGALVDDIPHLVRLVAPNISVKLPEYSDAQLVAMLRNGVKPDGKSVVFMPSEMYRHLGEQDLARLIAWLRTVPATPAGIQEETEIRAIGRFLLAKGDFKTAAEAIKTLPPALDDVEFNDPVSRGRYLTMSFCSECHGQALEGFPPINAPPLAVAKAYSLEQFTRLLRDGTATGDRELKLMGPTSRVRFSLFAPDEIAAVHAFLQTLK